MTRLQSDEKTFVKRDKDDQAPIVFFFFIIICETQKDLRMGSLKQNQEDHDCFPFFNRENTFFVRSKISPELKLSRKSTTTFNKQGFKWEIYDWSIFLTHQIKLSKWDKKRNSKTTLTWLKKMEKNISWGKLISKQAFDVCKHAHIFLQAVSVRN